MLSPFAHIKPIRRVSGTCGRMPKYKLGRYGPHVQTDVAGSVARDERLGGCLAETAPPRTRSRAAATVSLQVAAIEAMAKRLHALGEERREIHSKQVQEQEILSPGSLPRMELAMNRPSQKAVVVAKGEQQSISEAEDGSDSLSTWLGNWAVRRRIEVGSQASSKFTSFMRPVNSESSL